MHHRLLNWPWLLWMNWHLLWSFRYIIVCMWCYTAQSVLALNISSEGRGTSVCGARRIARHARPSISCLTTIDLHHYRFLSYFARLLDACQGASPVAKYSVHSPLKWYYRNYYCRSHAQKSSIFVRLFTIKSVVRFTSTIYVLKLFIDCVVSYSVATKRFCFKFNLTNHFRSLNRAWKCRT